jgi:hypothetical protein
MSMLRYLAWSCNVWADFLQAFGYWSVRYWRAEFD